MTLKETTLALISGNTNINGYKRFDKLLLIETIRTDAAQAYTEDFWKIFDSNDFYACVLNRVGRVCPQALNALCEKLQELSK